MALPPDYIERVYAGVLGKMIGVYLGRPFEGWTYERIMDQLGEVDHYVHETLGVPLIVTDDDLSGTFTFIRALADHAAGKAITPAQIGQTWLNYVLERRTIFWWGGMGNSTEHTAFLRLKQGIEAPRSGAIATNGKIVAEQIGAQIFIDGWGMVAPGDPELAAELAKRAASVSHDGEAIYGAQVMAAMESQAFVEPDRFKLLDTAVRFIPQDSMIYRLIADLRDWHAREPDWRKTRKRIVEHYGYQKYVGGCHMVPNHALIILGLLYGEDDFRKTLMITNTCGWDTDCNSGNIGCLMGIKLGLAGIEAPRDGARYDWRGPVADRLLLPTADGGNAISDAVREAYRIANMGRALAGEAPVSPKQGARFLFSLPGSVQGFQAEQGGDNLPGVTVVNVPGHSRLGSRALAIRFNDLMHDCFVRAATPTFMTPADVKMPGYSLYASPTLYSGQVVRAGLTADIAARVRFFLRCYDGDDQPQKVNGPLMHLEPGASQDLQWTVPDLQGKPIYEIGLELSAASNQAGDPTPAPYSGTLYLDYLTWDGAPAVTFQKVPGSGQLWRSAWVDGVDQWEKWGAAFRPIQNTGRGLLSIGSDGWTDYHVAAPLTIAMAKAAGIAVRVQGTRRFYGLCLCGDGKARLIKALEGGDRVLAEADFAWDLWSRHTLEMETRGSRIRTWVDGQPIFDILDEDRPLCSGGAALLCEEGHLLCDQVTIGS